LESSLDQALAEIAQIKTELSPQESEQPKAVLLVADLEASFFSTKKRRPAGRRFD
jgi:hypothetical protein